MRRLNILGLPAAATIAAIMCLIAQLATSSTAVYRMWNDMVEHRVVCSCVAQRYAAVSNQVQKDMLEFEKLQADVNNYLDFNSSSQANRM